MIGPDRCPRCLFPRRVCLCADIPTVTTRTRVVIVRHHLERWRASNSGRLAHLALPNSAIVDHGGHDGPAALPALAGAYLVFPAGEPATTAPVPPPAPVYAPTPPVYAPTPPVYNGYGTGYSTGYPSAGERHTAHHAHAAAPVPALVAGGGRGGQELPSIESGRRGGCDTIGHL